ncbi:Transcriptional regulator, AbiEi antitoxin, Type IV TA system [Promicromonospora thailandica]|uniref:Transcriptional regulator, AbiEi antitoxin, Type IV TA system n=2 Tax=Promicromonospora thailandica TaxID=765201 RepID=A0A9X2JY24_9MICO|nr:Transcriptional regulator, AbiEi antitoxin, Type IV TA system [Promicromonospora thailandica]
MRPAAAAAFRHADRMSEILLARDHDYAVLRRALAARDIERLRRGAYTAVDPAAAPIGAAEHARRRAEQTVVAVHRQLTAHHVVSHESAALLHGAPVWEMPSRVHLIQRYGSNAGSAPDIVRHRSILADDEIVTVAGVPVTSVTRTVLDCVCTMPPLAGLVLADWALGTGVERAGLLAALADRSDRRNRRQARLVLDLADGGAQSPWETRTRYVLLRAGFPRPRTQVPVVTRLGTFHCDVGWDGWGPLIEFDGFVKYQDGVLRPGYDADAARFVEKRRDDAIRATGRALVRVTARDKASDIVRWVLRETPAHQRPRLDPRLDLPEP